jgi:hypothetical protein
VRARGLFILLLAAIASGCAHFARGRAADRAFVEARKHFDAGDWQGAIDILEPSWKANPAPPTKDAVLLYSRAHRRLGHLAEALDAFDRAKRYGHFDKAELAERDSTRDQFLGTLAGPTSSSVRLWYREKLPPQFSLQRIEYVLDEKVLLSWTAASAGKPFDTSVPVAVVSAVPGNHYLRMTALYSVKAQRGRAGSTQLSFNQVVSSSPGRTTDLFITFIERGGPSSPLGVGLGVEALHDEH